MRIAAGQFDAIVLGFLQRGFSIWLDAQGAVPLERCLRLPTGAKAIQRERRDSWLLEVAKRCEGSSPWGRASEVKRHLDEFLSRGQWRAWCKLSAPPPGTSELSVALFMACKHSTRPERSLSQRTICEVIGKIFT